MDYPVIGDNTLVKCSPTVDVNLNAQIDKHYMYMIVLHHLFIYLILRYYLIINNLFRILLDKRDSEH